MFRGWSCEVAGGNTGSWDTTHAIYIPRPSRLDRIRESSPLSSPSSPPHSDLASYNWSLRPESIYICNTNPLAPSVTHSLVGGTNCGRPDLSEGRGGGGEEAATIP